MTTDANEGTRPQIERSHKRLRALLAGEPVFDTTRSMLVWEVPHYPAYYVPTEDVTAHLVPTGRTKQSPGRGEACYFDVKVGSELAPGAAWMYPDSPVEELRDLVRFRWAAFDEWLEEDEPVYVHPRDPYKRVDILSSSRHVEVVVDGVTVADSRRPLILFETGLPPRYYLPMTDLRTDLLRPSNSETRCPYKGTATYWSLQVGDRVYEDFVWTYRSPVAESQKIAGLLCFYNEKVDLYVDGILQERPHTKFG